MEGEWKTPPGPTSLSTFFYRIILSYYLSSYHPLNFCISRKDKNKLKAAMNLGRLCQIILKSDKEVSGYGQLAQHAIFAYHMVRQTPVVAVLLYICCQDQLSTTRDNNT